VAVEYCQVTTTTDARESAERLARSTVEARLAACAQVVGPIQSTYRWEGTVETAEEWMVLFKTAADRYPALEQHIRGHHPYDVPEIISVPVTAGNPAYLSWLSRETRGSTEGVA
jgi:periplasmic divalent cation tolerance protein